MKIIEKDQKNCHDDELGEIWYAPVQHCFIPALCGTHPRRPHYQSCCSSLCLVMQQRTDITAADHMQMEALYTKV